MAKIFTQEHADRYTIVKRYFKQMIKDNFFVQNWSNQYAEDNGREPIAIDKTIEKAYNLLFGYKNAMPEYIKALMKKGEKFSLQTSGYRYVLKSKETADEPYSSKIIDAEEFPVDKENLFYANIRYYDEFTETGLQYLFGIEYKQEWNVFMQDLNKNNIRNKDFVRIVFNERDVEQYEMLATILEDEQIQITVLYKSLSTGFRREIDKKSYTLTAEEVKLIKQYAGIDPNSSLTEQYRMPPQV